MEQLKVLNPEHATDTDVQSFSVRKAARAVVYDDDKRIALLHVTKKHYYKLPGGGLDEGETVDDALLRECFEEIGRNVEVKAELGELIEYRKLFGIKQISYCFIAKAIGEQLVPEFTQEELTDGFELVWVPYREALDLVRDSVTDNDEGRLYIVPRDTILLEATKGHFE